MAKKKVVTKTKKAAPKPAVKEKPKASKPVEKKKSAPAKKAEPAKPKRKFKSVRKVSGIPKVFRKWKDWEEGDVVIGKYVGSGIDNYKKDNWLIEVEDAQFADDSGEDFIGKTLGLNSCGMLDKAMEEIEEGEIVQVTYTGMGEIESGQYAGSDSHKVAVEIVEPEDEDGDDEEGFDDEEEIEFEEDEEEEEGYDDDEGTDEEEDDGTDDGDDDANESDEEEEDEGYF